MEFKGTKGKWVNNTPIDSNGYQNIESEDGLTITTCYGGFERSIPNAKLIAAAPEMFELLKTLLDEPRIREAMILSGENSLLNDNIKIAKQLLKKITQ